MNINPFCCCYVVNGEQIWTEFSVLLLTTCCCSRRGNLW